MGSFELFESPPSYSNRPRCVQITPIVFEWPLPCSSHDRCALACPTTARLTPPRPPAACLTRPPCRLAPQCPCHLACPPPACLTPPPPPARFTPPHPTAGLVSPRCVLLLHFDLAPRHCLTPPFIVAFSFSYLAFPFLLVIVSSSLHHHLAPHRRLFGVSFRPGGRIRGVSNGDWKMDGEIEPRQMSWLVFHNSLLGHST